MAVTPDQFAEIADGDQAFYRVDTRRPPHELETGVAADAINCRFEDGRAWPRYGVNQQAWGLIPGKGNNLIKSLTWPTHAVGGYTSVAVAGFVVGKTYVLVNLGNALTLATDIHTNSNRTVITVGVPFTASQTSYILESRVVGAVVTAVVVVQGSFKVTGYARFNDPEGYDTQIVVTDDWRDGMGEDGGRGRAWRIQPGNPPLEVSLNGHDIWDTARLVPCYNGVILLRHGNERHYFNASRDPYISSTDATNDYFLVDTTHMQTGNVVTSSLTGSTVYYARVVLSGTISLYDTAAHANAGGATGRYDVTVDNQTGWLQILAVDPATAEIQLNAPQNWADGDRVTFYVDNTYPGGSYFSGSAPPQNATSYFVKRGSGNWIGLYSNQGLSTPVTFTSARGRFWIERNADQPGFYGNAAPPLLAQPDGVGKTLWANGFNGVPVTLNVTTTDSSTNLVTVPNHRLLPGDHVNVTGLHTTGAAAIATAYVYPVSDHAVRFYTTQLGALSQDVTTVIAQVGAETGTITKAGASGLPCPGGREGAFYQNRLLIVNGRDTLAISDALDPLHFTPFEAAVTANLGESSQIMALWPLGTNDAVLVLRENEVEILGNFSGGPSAWTLTSLTREYGCIAPLSVAQVGNDVWFLSRKGVASITQTQNGVLQGVADPVSKAMKKYIDQIDWRHANQACGGYWNNRYFVAVPLKGQSGTPVNNGVLSHYFLNSGSIRGAQDGVYHFETMFGWEGLWQGATLQPFNWARLSVFGDERICFVNAAGQVGWLGDGFLDGTTPIVSVLTTRRYTSQNSKRKLWLAANVTVDSYAPNLTVTAIFPGVNERQVMLANKTYSKTAHGVWGLADYDPATATSQAFNAPYREDYQISAAELLLGAPDTHQNHTVPARMRRLEWGVQLQITNAAGSARIGAVEVGGTQRGVLAVDAV